MKRLVLPGINMPLVPLWPWDPASGAPGLRLRFLHALGPGASLTRSWRACRMLLSERRLLPWDMAPCAERVRPDSLWVPSWCGARGRERRPGWLRGGMLGAGGRRG